MNQNSSTDPDQHRFALAVEYDGSAFCGWQRQQSPELPTVQSILEDALSQVADHPVTTTCAGRTDTGVHATCQVVHFDSAVDRGNKAWTRGVNSLLPDAVRVVWSKQMDMDFHARFSATARRYVYIIYCAEAGSALLAGKLCHVRQSLNTDAMHEAAQFLLGEQDFSSFRAAGCQSKTPFREVFAATVREQGELVVFDIHANAFLQHMVRNIVGALMAVGRGDQSPAWVRQLLEQKDRTQAGIAAVPDGLYLMQVDYPQRFGLPTTSRLPLVLGPAQS